MDRSRLVEYAVRLRDCPCVSGLYIMPAMHGNDRRVWWEGVFFCRHGPNSPSVIRFVYSDDEQVIRMSCPAPQPNTEERCVDIVFDACRLVEDPLQWQQRLKSLLETTPLPGFDPLQTLTFDSLYKRRSRMLQFREDADLQDLLADARLAI